MTVGALTPDLALGFLGELSTDFRAGVVLDAQRRRLAGPVALATAAAQLVSVCGQAAEVDVSVPGGFVFVASSSEYSLVAVTRRFALPGLVRHDMRDLLSRLPAGGGPGGSERPLALSPASGPPQPDAPADVAIRWRPVGEAPRELDPTSAPGDAVARAAAALVAVIDAS